jgi:hypothetical protein
MYVLWHTQRQGWVSATGTSTNFDDAKKFDGTEAFKYCERHVSHEQVPGVVPVLVADIAWILA